MLPFFPEPYPDELLYSILARYHVRSGNTSPKMTMNELFGSISITAVYDLPSHLESLHKNTSFYNEHSLYQLIINHTLYPYYQPFIPPERAQVILKSMKENRGNFIHSIAGIMATSVSTPKYFKFCWKCIKEDQDLYGEIYWHRVHQTPGVKLCTKHGEFLQDSLVLIHGLNRHEFVAASFEKCMVKCQDSILNFDEKAKLAYFSKEIEWLFINSIQPRPLNWYQERYISLLYKAGLSSREGFVDQDALFYRFIGFYGNRVLAALGSDVVMNDESSWLRAIVRKHRKTFHPIRHLLLIIFLTESFKRFLNVDLNPISLKHIKTMRVKPTLNIADNDVNTNKEQYRFLWLELQKKYPNLSKTQIRKESPRIFTWLYRWDREWLDQNSPRKGPVLVINTRVNWVERDKSVLVKVQKAVEKLKSTKGKPIKITVSKVGKMSGYLALIEKHIDKMPNTNKYLQTVVETLEEFQIRRVYWAVNELEKRGEPIKVWRIEKIVGLKPGYSQSVALEINRLVGLRNFTHKEKLKESI